MVIKRKNSKLLSRPKTSQNLKFCFIRIAHLMTYIRWLWSLLCITIFFILLIYELNYSCTYLQKDIISIKNIALKNWRLLIKIVLFETWKFTYLIDLKNVLILKLNVKSYYTVIKRIEMITLFSLSFNSKSWLYLFSAI